MRNLFFMLVIANVLFFGWQFWVREPEPVGVTIIDPEEIGERVELIGDAVPELPVVPTAALDSVPDAPAKAVVASIGRICVSIGPFTEVEDAQAELRALRSGNADVVQRAAQGNLFVGHWVYVDSIATRSQARALLAKLQDGGIKEAYLIGGNPGEDVISLGIFSSLDGAERTELRAKSIGIEARMDDRYRQSTVFWLDLRLQQGEQGSALVESYGEDKVLLGDRASCPQN